MKIAQALKRAVVAAVVAGAMLLAPSAANAAVFVSVGFAPPAIPVYEQPIAPGYGYIWTPGYWAYGPDGYYWVDGAWVYPPYVDALWTPGYWGWGDGGYFWNAGYWGRNIGYYGGINYGFGYFGTGFYGGYWNRGHFFYNGAYNHIGFHNGFVYNHPVAGFDGHPGGAAFARGAGEVNRGAGINGNNVAGRGSFAGNATRPAYNGGVARGFTGGNTNAGRASTAAAQPRSFSGARQPQTRSFSSGGQAQTRSSSGRGQAQARSFSGGGGGVHGGSGGGARGGGGGSHGGGGGGHGGGGRR